jgi:hypothetical protein
MAVPVNRATDPVSMQRAFPLRIVAFYQSAERGPRPAAGP